MGINVQKALESAGGFAVSDSSGNTLGFYTAGTGSPIGNACPEPTIYINELFEVWKNTGPGPSDWVQLGQGGDPFLTGLFDMCTPLFDCDMTTGQVVLLEECG